MHGMRRCRGRAAMQAGVSSGMHRGKSGLGGEQGRSTYEVSAAASLSAIMAFTNRISQTLHDEHRATIALLERLEQLIARHRRSVPDVSDRAVSQLLSDVATGVADEVRRHFDCEEHQLL